MGKIVIIPEDETQEFADTGLHHHSMVQANLAYLFKAYGNVHRIYRVESGCEPSMTASAIRSKTSLSPMWRSIPSDR